MGELVIKEYTKEDRDGCIELLKETFLGSSDEDTFIWRFENSSRRKPILIVAKQNEKVVSFNSWIPWEFSYNNKIFLGYQSGESATKIEYRGKGIWGKVFQVGQEIASDLKVDFLFGFPNQNSYGGAIKAGYYPVGTFSFHLRFMNIFRKDKVSERSFVFPSSLFMIQNEKITPEINNDYCKWRYFDNTKKIEFIEYSEDNCQAIFFFREKLWKGLKELILLDCQFSSYNEKFIENAFKNLNRNLSGKAFLIRTFFNENSDRGNILKKYFMFKVKSKCEKLMVKPISDKIDLNVLLNCNNWDIMPHCVDNL